jgi:hypothetical protein
LKLATIAVSRLKTTMQPIKPVTVSVVSIEFWPKN